MTKERALELFIHRDGALFNRVRRGPLALAGQQVGSPNKWGYLQVQVDERSYRVHRVIWLMEKGRWPGELDHINGNRTDNRIENLREVTRQDNMRNNPLSSKNSSGSMGVSWDSSMGKWRARLAVNRKSVHLGYFKNKSDAIAARDEANRKHGFHVNHGKLSA